MIHASHSPGGGFVIGLSGFGRSVWLQREANCHRWRAWLTRVPQRGLPRTGGGDGLDATGAREPRRPTPNGSAGSIALDPPTTD